MSAANQGPPTVINPFTTQTPAPNLRSPALQSILNAPAPAPNPLPAAPPPVQQQVMQGDTAGLGAQPPGALVSPSATQSLANLFAAPAADFRARLSPLNPADVYGSNVANFLTMSGFTGGELGGVNSLSAPATTGLMDALAATNGVIFPYTPTIAYAQPVTYTDLQLVHSDTDYPAYTRTPSVTLNVTGKFTVQNQTEGAYALAVIHFLRTVSKSYFGEIDQRTTGKAGLPPPVLLFSAYGPYMYNRLRVILKNHSWSYDENMDTIAVNVPSIGGASAGQVRLPAMFSISTELMVIQTPQRMRTQFSFDAFASGKLMGSGDGGWL